MASDPRSPLQFSLFFFAAPVEDRPVRDVYRLMFEAVKFADRNGFKAVWTPERHFQKFGGLYPNPSLTSAALAMITENLKLRSGSIVLPLQNVLRVAEEWAFVDNVSGGRVGMSFASGWHPNDFVLAPESYERRREDLPRRIAMVQKLWRGEKVKLPNGEGTEIEVGILPRPLQPELEVWLTCQSDGGFEHAARGGFNVLTNLNYKKLVDLERKAGLYHDTFEASHSERGHFTLMCHTFVGTGDDHVWDVAGSALQDYLETRVDMDSTMHQGLKMSAEDRAFLARRGAEQFLGETSLIGTVDECRARARRFHELGVDELGCLIDFGVPFDEVMASLERVRDIKNELESA